MFFWSWNRGGLWLEAISLARTNCVGQQLAALQQQWHYHTFLASFVCFERLHLHLCDQAFLKMGTVHKIQLSLYSTVWQTWCVYNFKKWCMCLKINPRRVIKCLCQPKNLCRLHCRSKTADHKPCIVTPTHLLQTQFFFFINLKNVLGWNCLYSR